MTEPAAPRRFEPGAGYRNTQITPRGTVVVRLARPWGHAAYFASDTPCCHASVRFDAGLWAGTGALVTCRSCGWKWDVYLALGARRLGVLPRGIVHPHINADRAEWVSTGDGTRPYRRKAS